MGSQQNDGTSYPPSEAPKPCANNCGFFGSSRNQNFCSKCYKDLCLEEERASKAKEAMDKSLFYHNNVVAPSATQSHDSVVHAPKYFSSVGHVEPSKVANRCASCKKKVGLIGFVCKCGITFCGTHRYPEKHQCSYDYKADGRDAISKANPLVKADKVKKF